MTVSHSYFKWLHDFTYFHSVLYKELILIIQMNRKSFISVTFLKFRKLCEIL